MRKRIDIYTVLFVAVLAIVSGLLSLVFSNQNTVNSADENTMTTISPQGIWHDDTSNTWSMNISHDKYGDPSGTDYESWFIYWDRSAPGGDNKAMIDPAEYNLISVSLTATQGNSPLKFHIKRKNCSNSFESDKCYKMAPGRGQVEGYDVNSGLILIYVNGQIKSSHPVNLEKGNVNLEFDISTSNEKINWNTNYEIKLVLAFMYYNWYHHDIWYYKGIATKTICFNDTVKPTGTLKDVNGNVLSNDAETNKNVYFTWDDDMANATLDGSVYSKNNTISNEGNHTIVLTDQVSLSNTYKFKIDKTAPASNFEYPQYGTTRYTAGNIEYEPIDNLSEIKSREVKFGENGTWVSNQTEAGNCNYNVQFQGNKIIVPSNEANNGKWYFRATDSVGNTSQAECVELMKLSFGNQWRIRESYKQSTWYNITLPASFNKEENDTQVYTAATYEIALAFATSKEWQYRVQTLSTGNWKYVSSVNSNLTQEYTDRTELDAVVNKYASSYISERKIAKNGKNTYGQIINDNLENDETALTQQNLEAKSFTGNLPVYFLNANFKFENPGFAVETHIEMQMVGNTAKMELQYDVTVGSQIFSDEDNKQGYYLVREWDEAGNEEKYYVYIDISAPTLEAYATRGDGSTKVENFTAEYVFDYNDTFRYISLDLSRIVDSIDEYTMMKINGRKLAEVYYAQGDELPLLDGVTYYGKYDIEVYDRSGNTLTFYVTIAGEAPYLSTTSLTNETSCRLTLNVNDKTNAIKNLKMYRILYDGTYVQMTEDHKGVTVEPSTLQYTLTTGGKYTFWYEDMYSRTVECAPIFYLKGLPTATLSGVSEGGITNRNVTLRFNDSDKLILYKVENGVRTEIPASDYFSCVFDETTHKGTASLTANEETSGSYVFFLYKADEISLFVEYTFSIDCIIAPIYIIDSSGNEVTKNAYTNNPFTIYWSETVTLRYYTDTTPGGELGAIRYELGKPFTVNGMYYFTLRDTVGNEETFTILLDTVVSYQIAGEYKKLGEHEYLAKQDLQFTITETNAVQVFNSTPSIVNGGVITTEGIYTIQIVDAYGNSATITIRIDKSVPTIVLDGTVDGGYTKNSVTVTTFDSTGAYLVNKNNQIISAIEDGIVFDDEGTYRIMAVDEAGNTTIVVFTINRSVPFESNIPHTAITTGVVTFKFLGELQDETVQFSRYDNLESAETIASKSKYTEPGTYSIFAVDTIGNEFYFSFTILPTRLQGLQLENLADIEVTATRNKLAYVVELVDNTLILTDEGNYVLNFYDTKKNIEYSFNVTVDNSVSVVSSIPNHSFTADTVQITFGETVKQEVIFEGEVIKNAKQYSKAGHYEIKATDELGNEIVFQFRIMPARLRVLNLENLNDVELLLVTKDDKEISVSLDENNSLELSTNGHYVLFFKRITGEMFNLICDIDNTKPTIEIEKEPGSFKTTNASKENLTATLSCNGAEATAYTVGKKINGAGHYTLTITDDLGNENVYTFDITEPLNWAAYASIGGLGLLGAVALIVVLKAKRRVKTR